jgi:hypothetical protein
MRLVKHALLASSLVAVAALSARAEDAGLKAEADCCAPATRTVCVKEWVPEHYQATRTVYSVQCKTEQYTAYRCETVPVQQTRTVTVYKQVAETKTVPRTVCTCVPTCETRTVMKRQVTCVPETKCVTKCVSRGHWECHEVECGPSLSERLHNRCHKDCCGDPCPPPCPRTKTVRCWVPCKEYETHTVTCMKKVVTCVPVTCQVTVNKIVQHTENVQVTCYRCVPEQKVETYTACVQKQVPYQATRTVKVCVPHQETYTACRMVCRTVEKQVPVSPCCETRCCKSRLHDLFRGHGCSNHENCCD